MEDESKGLKRRDLLQKAAVAGVATVLGTVVVEAAPEVAEGEEPIHLIFGGGGITGQGHGRTRKLLSHTPMPNTGNTSPPGPKAIKAAIITQKQPPFYQEDFLKYFPSAAAAGLQVSGWYEIDGASLFGHDGKGEMHGAWSEASPDPATGGEPFKTAFTVAPEDLSINGNPTPVYIVLLN